MDQCEHVLQLQRFVDGGIRFQVRFREFEQSRRRPEPAFLQVDESARELNQAFVEGVVRLPALSQPEFFQDIVGFIKKLAIETLEVPEIMRVQLPSPESFD
jgi:hypothetical protein